MFHIPWFGMCGRDIVEGTSFCARHIVLTCMMCGGKATQQCMVAGSMTCCAPLCSDQKCTSRHNDSHYGKVKHE